MAKNTKDQDVATAPQNSLPDAPVTQQQGALSDIEQLRRELAAERARRESLEQALTPAARKSIEDDKTVADKWPVKVRVPGWAEPYVLERDKCLVYIGQWDRYYVDAVRTVDGHLVRESYCIPKGALVAAELFPEHAKMRPRVLLPFKGDPYYKDKRRPVVLPGYSVHAVV